MTTLNPEDRPVTRLLEQLTGRRRSIEVRTETPGADPLSAPVVVVERAANGRGLCYVRLTGRYDHETGLERRRDVASYYYLADACLDALTR